MNKIKLIEICEPYTMSPAEHIAWLGEIVDEINLNQTQGSFVECGVWRGGCALSMMLAQKEHDTNRDIYLYDTFEGMASVTGAEEEHVQLKNHCPDLCRCSLQDLKSNLSVAQYPADRTFFVKGDVCDTLNMITPEKISILRLDTDFYESTRKELEVLAPKVTAGGYVIIDDYWAYAGSRRATLDWYKLNEDSFELITPDNGPSSRKRYRKAFQRKL